MLAVGAETALLVLNTALQDRISTDPNPSFENRVMLCLPGAGA
jgi:hypothetical protein